VAVENDAIEIVDLLLVTSLKPRANGQSRGKRSRVSWYRLALNSAPF
jgi:hypothetical protein